MRNTTVSQEREGKGPVWTKKEGKEGSPALRSLHCGIAAAAAGAGK